jgi:hypothetical protein
VTGLGTGPSFDIEATPELSLCSIVGQALAEPGLPPEVVD